MPKLAAAGHQVCWVLDCTVMACPSCAASSAWSLFSSVADYHVEVVLTDVEHANMVNTSAVGAAAFSNARMHNSNIQLATMRHFPVSNVVGTAPDDELLAAAARELWPWLASLFSSSAEPDVHGYFTSLVYRTFCCYRNSSYCVFRRSMRRYDADSDSWVVHFPRTPGFLDSPPGLGPIGIADGPPATVDPPAEGHAPPPGLHEPPPRDHHSDDSDPDGEHVGFVPFSGVGLRLGEVSVSPPTSLIAQVASLPAAAFPSERPTRPPPPSVSPPPPPAVAISPPRASSSQVGGSSSSTSSPPIPTAPADMQIYEREVCPGWFLHFDKGLVTAADDTAAIGVRFGPPLREGLFYANNTDNLRLGIQQRITNSHVPLTASQSQLDELSDVARHIAASIRNDRDFDIMVREVLFGQKEEYDGIKSKKWHAARFSSQLERLMMEYDPQFKLKTAVKVCRNEPGKAPRVLIADQDAGQVMSCFTIGVLETWLKWRHGKKGIKGKPISSRILDIAADTCRRNNNAAHTTVLLENDGSAWDTCCSHELREATENIVIDAVIDRLRDYVIPVNAFSNARRAVDKKRNYVMQGKPQVILADFIDSAIVDDTMNDALFETMRKGVKIRIAAIRRSGDRGTSTLNFLLNMICWSWVLFGVNAVAFLSHMGQACVDIFGARNHAHAWFEGDDSLLAILRKNAAAFSDAEMAVLTARWTLLGHRPKLFRRLEGDVVEFVGYKMIAGRDGVDVSTVCVDVPRMLNNIFYSASKDVIRAVTGRNPTEAAKLVAVSLIARAMHVADRFPSIAFWLLGRSEELAPHGAVVSREDVMKIDPSRFAGTTPKFSNPDSLRKQLEFPHCDIVEACRTRVLAGSHTIVSEVSLATRYGWVASPDEWSTFVSALPAVTCGASRSALADIAPRGMR
jgi:hypothetical protein